MGISSQHFGLKLQQPAGTTGQIQNFGSMLTTAVFTVAVDMKSVKFFFLLEFI